MHPTDLRALHVSHDEIDSDTYLLVHVLLYDVINFHISGCEIRHLMNSAPLNYFYFNFQVRSHLLAQALTQSYRTPLYGEAS